MSSTTLRFVRAAAGVSFAFSILSPLHPAVAAATITVGPTQYYKTIQAGIGAANPGDIINIQSGTYGCATINKSHLTLQGVGTTQPVIQGASCGDKGLFVVSGSNTTVSNLQFKNATSTSGNGAGIRMQGTNLTVHNSKFANDQNGILADANTASTLTVTNSTFDHNGTCISSSGCAHGIYAGHIAKLDVESSTFTNTQAGHAIKSRANNTVVLNNTIQDTPTGTSAYLLDVSNGGAVTVTGNYFEKGPNSTNSTTAIAMGEEGASNPAGAMLIANNTFQNDLSKTHEFIWNKTGNGALIVSGNVLKGYATTLLNGLGTISNASLKTQALALMASTAPSYAAAEPVPEPTTLAMFLSALVGLGLIGMHRRDSRAAVTVPWPSRTIRRWRLGLRRSVASPRRPAGSGTGRPADAV